MNVPSTSTTITTSTLRGNTAGGRRRARRQRPGRQGGGQPSQKPTPSKTGVTLADLLSPCARDYLSVLENPFSGKVACVPSLPSIPSRKVRYWAKGTMATGANSFGFVAFNPFNITNNQTAENEISIYFTDGNFAPVQTDYNSATVGVQHTQLNSEYATTQQADFRYKLVGAGLRVRYSGTELNRGGRIFMLEEPDHASTDAYTLSSISRYDTHRVFRPDQNWKSCVFHPADEDEFDYLDYSSRNTRKFLLAAIEAPDNLTVVSFEWEVDAVYELIGPVIRGLTPTPVDLGGLSAVQTFTNSSNTRAPREGDRSGWVSYALNQAGRLLWDTSSSLIRAYLPRPPPQKLIRGATTPTYTEPIIEFL